MVGKVRFHSARPIWPEGKEREKNLLVGFRTAFEAPSDKKLILRATASSLYRFFINGKFVGYGPARGPRGYFRIDEWDLAESLVGGRNLLAVEVAGYNVNGYYLLDQPAFLQAEVVADGEVLASTAGEGEAFSAGILEERVQKVQRYSAQRTFSEVYRLQEDYDRWRKDVDADFVGTKCAVFEEKRYLPRWVPYPRFQLRQPVWLVSHGKLETSIRIDRLWKPRTLTDIGPKFKGFEESELEVIPSIELQKLTSIPEAEGNYPYSPKTKLKLAQNSYHILDLGTNLTGFLGCKVSCPKKTWLLFIFDELLTDGDVDFKRLGCVNVVTYELEAGSFELETIEPYQLRYLKLIVLQGECEVENIHLREYANPEVWQAHFAASDWRLNKLFAAARETFRQNAVDIFMDCPSRERAGWLCDSFFTARAAVVLSGNTLVEKSFYQNFLLPEKFEHIPEGMLPMCYPADHYRGVFIPSWAMWFVVELEEYLARSGDRETVEALKPKVMRLFEYFERFKNQDGLLEKLDGWVFVEWSKANDFVQDVNYPNNCLYAGALSAAGRMYNRPELLAEAEGIRAVIRGQSFDGSFFVDNAVRQGGKLQPTRNRTETCQYYAFFFGVAAPNTHPGLWQILCEQFGPKRSTTKEFPEIHQANAFIGNMLRMEILSRFGKGKQLLKEVADFYLPMAGRTGTLWEYMETSASCNHGFGSHIVHILYRDILGLHRLDTVNKLVELRFAHLPLDWCTGRVPTTDGPVNLAWWKQEGGIVFRVSVPAGYELRVENVSGKALIQQP